MSPLRENIRSSTLKTPYSTTAGSIPKTLLACEKCDRQGSVIKGDLAWYSEGLPLVHCRIIGTCSRFATTGA